MKIDPRKVYKLKGTTQHYDWGGFEYIPQLLGIENSSKQPYAEYWMGAHNSAPSILIDEEVQIALDKLFVAQPNLLGKEFQQLPFLFKVLDVKEMLSIQVHPNKEEAEKGFAAEEKKGIAINAVTRNYKDKNHKPEVMIALSDFWLLHGFKPKEALMQTLNAIPQLRSLISIFEKNGYKGLYSYVMEFPQQKVDAMLKPLVKKEVRRRSYNESEKNEAGFWVGEYYRNKKIEKIDRGIFAIYFFNIVHLTKGQGIFQEAGIPHAYLRGQNIELMANSDNVLRGGLTNKHTDIPELIKHTKFSGIIPDVLTGIKVNHTTIYLTPVKDFTISTIEVPVGEFSYLKTKSVEIVICLEGSAEVRAANTVEIQKGEAFVAFANAEYAIEAKENCLLFKAAVP